MLSLDSHNKTATITRNGQMISISRRAPGKKSKKI